LNDIELCVQYGKSLTNKANDVMWNGGNTDGKTYIFLLPGLYPENKG
jgi:hypothetical protein